MLSLCILVNDYALLILLVAVLITKIKSLYDLTIVIHLARITNFNRYFIVCIILIYALIG